MPQKSFASVCNEAIAAVSSPAADQIGLPDFGSFPAWRGGARVLLGLL
jgi:hypothetical protein